MSKKSVGLKEVALAKPITTLLPKSDVDAQKVDRSASKIHAQKVIRVSVDLPPDLYKKVKHDSFDAGLSLKAFLIQMIEAGYQSK